jgi:hypothetical protein
MYLPKFKHTAALYTFGEEFAIASTGELYTGFYIRTSKGTFYTGTEFKKNQSQELIKTSALSTSTYRNVGREKYDDAAKVTINQLLLKETQPVPSYTYIPDYELKINRRFFAKSKITGSIIEIDRDTYKELYSKSNKYHHPSYEVILIDWDLSSPVDDSVNGSYIVEGSKTKNKKQVLKLDKTLPGLHDYLTQTSQL